jgi:hypothetical protein
VKIQTNAYGFYIPCSHVAILAAFARQQQIDMQPILKQYDLTLESINTPGALMLALQYTQLLLALDLAGKNQPVFWFYPPKFYCLSLCNRLCLLNWSRPCTFCRSL